MERDQPVITILTDGHDRSTRQNICIPVIVRGNVLTDIHHVGHLTDEYEQTVTYYRDVFDGTVSDHTTVDDAVHIAFVEWAEFRVEVVCRERRGTHLDPLLDELSEVSPYHLAVVVADIDDAMAWMEREGFPMYDETPVEGLGPYVRAFVEPAAVPGFSVELVELDE
jgi:catechol 2,3-dioxygenase-like lactoylglutathione lyase family enzyme